MCKAQIGVCFIKCEITTMGWIFSFFLLYSSLDRVFESVSTCRLDLGNHF